MISAYSICSAVIFYNLALITVFILRRKTKFIAKYSTLMLLFISLLAVIRLMSPLDLEAAVVLPSYHLLPAIYTGIKTPIPLFGSVGTLLLVIWGCGTVGYLMRDMIHALRYYSEQRRYLYVEDARVAHIAAGFGGEYVVKISPDVPAPYVAGIFRPVIYLPAVHFSDEQLRFIMRHEVQHIISHDGLRKLFFLLVEALFWWNPISHMTVSEIDAILEMQCDSRITEGMDEQAKCDYLESLLSIMRYVSTKSREQNVYAISFVGNDRMMKQRFDLLMNRDNRATIRAHRILICSVLCIFALSFFVIAQPRQGAPQGNYVEISEGNSYILHADGSYYFYYNGLLAESISEQDLSVYPYSELEIIEGSSP